MHAAHEYSSGIIIIILIIIFSILFDQISN